MSMPHAPPQSRGSCTRSGWARARCRCTSGAGGDASAEMNPHWEMRLWTDDNLPPILNRNAWDACGNVGGTPAA